MLMEQRTYTLKMGNLERFLDLQIGRGSEDPRQILERLIGYFYTESGPSVQIVHLYRYDDYDDWVKRAVGLNLVENLQSSSKLLDHF
jgi:hypothetical protein